MNIMARLAVPALVSLCFAFTNTPLKRTVVIDAGHGGEDHGATHDHLSEKKLVQAIASKIKALDVSLGLDIVLLREDDVFMSLEDRVARINSLQPDLLVSLHVNYSQNRSDNGVRAYVAKKGEHASASVAEAQHMVNGLAGAGLAKKEVKDVDVYVLNHAKCPAMMLELGYLTNEKDRRYISSEAGQNEIAKKVMECLKK